LRTTRFGLRIEVFFNTPDMHTTLPIAQLTAAHAMAYKALMLHAYEHAADSFTSTPQGLGRGHVCA
jgi:hypothetical protein